MSEGLAKKLRLSLEEELIVLHCPDQSYFTDFNVSETLPTTPTARIILFVETIEEMKKEIRIIHEQNHLALEGRLLVCYPKKGNKKIATFVHRDEIFPALHVNEAGFIEGTDFKFNQMVKLDETYTILGIKRTKEQKQKQKTSHSVQDYVAYIPTLVQRLEQETDTTVLNFYTSLTPGYQKGWARYIYSAKREATQEKRYSEMVTLLQRGVKAKELA